MKKLIVSVSVLSASVFVGAIAPEEMIPHRHHSAPVLIAAGSEPLQDVAVHVIRSRVPERDDYDWLYGAALARHANRLDVSFGHKRGSLFVGYSNCDGQGGNYDSVELSIIPLNSLQVAVNGRSTQVQTEHLEPRIKSATFHSRTLNRDKTFCVVLPTGYDPSAGPWPVLYLLHGRGRNERTLIDDKRSREVLLNAPFVTVLPDGDDGWYIDSPVRTDDLYQSYTEEVIEAADSHFNLSPQRECRGLSGWSMGGYGCTVFAELHADRFAAVAPIIGLLDFPREDLPDGQRYTVPTDCFGEDPGVWRRFNPITHAEQLKATSVLIITADGAFDRTMNENFARRLKHLGINHQWQSFRGKHTFEMVQQALPVVIEFMTRKLEHAHR